MPRTGCHGTHPKAGSCGIGLCHHPPHPGLALLPWSSARTCTGSEYGSGGAVPFCRSFCRVCPRSSELAGGRGGTCALAAAYRQPGHHAVLSLASASPGRSKTVRLHTNPKLLTPPSGSACLTQGHGASGQPRATAPRRCFCCLAQNSHMPWATGQTTTESFPLSGPCAAFHPPLHKRSSNAS